MDLRPRKKQKHQDASSLEASSGQKTTILPSPLSTISTKRKYRAPSEATSPTDSTSAADLHPPSSKRTRFSTEETTDSNTSRYHFRIRASPPQPPPNSRTARHTGMPKSRGRDKKAGGEQQSTSTTNKTDKKSSNSRSASASTSKQIKGSSPLRALSSLFTRKRTSDRRELDTAVQDTTTIMPPSSSASSSKSKRSRRKDIPDLDDTHPDLMDLDHDEEIESPLDEQRMIDDEFAAAAAAAAAATAAAEENRGEEVEDNARPPIISSHIMRNLSSIRGIHGMMNNVHGTLKNILPNLRNYQDPTMQHIALQEFAELLAISTEETLAGYLSPEPYVIELIKILKGGEDYSPFGDNPDIMLLASRCMANLMEALPQSTGTVVYSGAVPVLCSKLLEIQYIDLAEQALSTLEKISVEYPTSIVREGGLTACLMYLDFFSTNVQRTAVTTAANCCRNIPLDSFDTVREIMPNLKGIISGTDQKVVEQGCLCIARIVEGFKNHPEKLEQLITEDILEAVLAILLPGNTSVAGSSTHTQLLRLLGLLVKNSAKLGAQMLKMNLVDTVYQILTGVSPPQDTDMESRKKTSIFVLQALIHRPHNQILETLNIVCDLFPDPPSNNDPALDLPRDDDFPYIVGMERSKPSREQRKQVLDECHDDVLRFTKILVPTLLDIYSSTIIFTVRQRVLNGLFKIFIFLDRETLKTILVDVQLASFLAGMLSQQDHPILTFSALRLAELLSRKLPDVYRMNFQREGIIAEVERLASDSTPTVNGLSDIPPSMEAQHLDTSEDDSEDERDQESDEDIESPYTSPQQMFAPGMPPPMDLIKKAAKGFLKHYLESGDKEEKKEGLTLRKLKSLGEKIAVTADDSTRTTLFKDLARYFEGDVDSITTFELLESKILEVLLSTLSNSENPVNTQGDFLRAFAEQRKNCTESVSPLEILVMKLQELLSRSERFEVISVSQGPYDDNRRNPASMLAKQIRLKVVAEDKSSVPKECQQFTVSIHAISQIHNLASFIRNKIVTHTARPASIAGGLRDPPELLRNFADRRGALEFAQLAQEMGFPVPPTLARRVAALTSTAPSTNVKTPGQSSSRRTSTRLKKDRDSSRGTLDMESRATASDPELDDMENDEELVDEMEDDEPENSVSVDVSTPTATPQGSRGPGSVASRSSAALSYAAALQQVPQDWHLEFEFGGHTIPFDSTVFEPLHRYSGLQTAVNGYFHIFSGMHTIKFRKLPGPPLPQGFSPSRSILILDSLNSGMDDSLIIENRVSSGADTSASILKLLKLLHSLSVRWNEILADTQNTERLRKPDLVSQFVNTKLTAKLNRQLEEPLLIASNCLPTWSQDLARHYPFLFPFETRYLFVQSTSFGYSRCMNRWVPQRTNTRADRRELPLGRQQRSKLKLQSRENFLRLALTAMYKYAHKPPVLEMEYEDEVGTGLGPTLEFYANTSKEFARRKLHMWRENDAIDGDEFLHVPNGLFPAPLPDGKSNEEEYIRSSNSADGSRMEYLFGGLGKFVARSMLDSRIIDIHFNPLFFRLAEKEEDDRPSVLSLRAVDNRLCESLKLLQRFADAKRDIQSDASLSEAEKLRRIKRIRFDETSVDDLALDFTLPGYSRIELKSGGKNIDVTIDNVDKYVDLVVDFTIGRGIKRQIDAFKRGFSSVFPYEALCAFTADELVMVFGKSDEDWSYDTLVDCVKADHGFNVDSRSIRNLLEILTSLSANDRRTFLQFLTGSPKLPIGGFKKLLPPFTVVCRPNEPPLTADDYLPSVMTCANYLKLPDYTSKEVMLQKIFTAMTEGSQSFHLS